MQQAGAQDAPTAWPPPEAKKTRASTQEVTRRQKSELEQLADNKELKQACVGCRVSVYWEGDQRFFRVRAPAWLHRTGVKRSCTLLYSAIARRSVQVCCSHIVCLGHARHLPKVRGSALCHARLSAHCTFTAAC